MEVCRSAYYKYHEREIKRSKNEKRLVEFVREQRKRQPQLGCKKIYYKDVSKDNIINVGRDKFLKILGVNGMHISPKKRFTKTTYSHHSYAVAPNRLKNKAITASNQVFVSDITYITLRRGFAYLFLVTDLYSRKIVGYYLSRSLNHKGAVSALDMATSVAKGKVEGTIHHSDRGCQYCCHAFLKKLSSYSMVPSMTDESHCYQNAVAERVNGILKQEFNIDACFKNFHQANTAIVDAIKIYNSERAHWNLNLKTPNEVYSQVA